MSNWCVRRLKHLTASKTSAGGLSRRPPTQVTWCGYGVLNREAPQTVMVNFVY